MTSGGAAGYDDGAIVCDDTGILIRNYYLWGAKQIPYTSIRGVESRPLNGVMSGRWRIWGTGDFVHWWNLDTRRPKKQVALVLDVGGRVRPTITPDDWTAVEGILREHVGAG